MTDHPDPKRPPGWEDDPDAPPSAEELAAAESLRDELEDPSSKHADVELARGLRHATNPKPIDQLAHRRILDRVVPRPRAIWYPIGLALSAAAAVALVTMNLRPSAPASTANLIRVHSTQQLFDAPFPVEGQTSKRMDTIVASRSRDLRANKWAKWGVK